MQRALSVPPSVPPPKLSHYSPMLHNALLALATAYSDDPRVHDIEFRRIFARRAKSYIEKDCLTPNVCVVGALSLLSTFHSSRGEQSLGYLYAGTLAFASLRLSVLTVYRYGWSNDTSS